MHKITSPYDRRNSSTYRYRGIIINRPSKVFFFFCSSATHLLVMCIYIYIYMPIKVNYVEKIKHNLKLQQIYHRNSSKLNKRLIIMLNHLMKKYQIHFRPPLWHRVFQNYIYQASHGG